MKIYKFDDFSGPEVAKIKKEIERRWKDLIFMQAKCKAEEVIEQLREREFYLADIITVSFIMGFDYLGLVQMAGRKRRKK